MLHTTNNTVHTTNNTVHSRQSIKMTQPNKVDTMSIIGSMRATLNQILVT